jgi:hypothetical protein
VLVGGDVLDEQGRNTAGGEEGRRPRRRAGVPGEGPANTGKQGAKEHRGEVRVRFPYPNWRGCGGRGLSMMRRSSGVSSEERHGVGAIPAREGWKLDQSRSGS